jgi:predicted DNA-binding WGR domain protein
VTVSGNTLKVRFGRIGSAGREKLQAFATPALAQKEQDKLAR